MTDKTDFHWSSCVLGAGSVLIQLSASGAEQAGSSDWISLAQKQVSNLDAALGVAPRPDGVIEIQPALVNLAIHFDSLITNHAEVTAWAMGVATATHGVQRKIRTHRFEVSYSPDVAHDLEAVADQTSMTPSEVVEAHLGSSYEVLMYGFAPGYGYLGGVPDEIAIPRKPSAVRNVEAGSVIIAGNQCLVTTVEMPTGWWVIGRSNAELLLDDPEHPFLMSVGDHVEFIRNDALPVDRRRAQDD